MQKHIWKYVRSYRFRSVFIKNLAIIILIIIVPFSLINGLVYNDFRVNIENEIQSECYDFMQKEINLVNNIFRSANYISIAVTMNEDVAMFMLPSAAEKPDNLGAALVRDINQFYLTNRYIDSISIYSDQYKLIVSNRPTSTLESSLDRAWLDPFFRNRQTEQSWVMARKYDGVYPYVISFARTTKNLNGAVCVNVSAEALRSDISRVSNMDHQTLLILDDQDNIMYDNNLENLGKKLSQAPEYSWVGNQLDGQRELFNLNDNIVQVSKVENLNLRYVLIIPQKAFHSKFDKLQGFMLLLFLLSLLMALLGALLISIRTYQPVRRIISALDEQTSPGASAEKLPIQENEINYIVNSIQRNQRSNLEMNEQLKKHVDLLNLAQTEALQNQINPHFLINTLESIKWMTIALSHNENKPALMLNTLGEFFRYMMDDQAKLVPLSKEIAYTKQYVEMILIRYEDMFAVHWDIPDVLMDQPILKITLQPIIENSIYHGLKPKGQTGYIRMSGHVEGRDMELVVQDDGVGMDAQTVDQINRNMAHMDIYGHSQIGLKNVNQRIKLLFGAEYGLYVESDGATGTTVRVRLPLSYD